MTAIDKGSIAAIDPTSGGRAAREHHGHPVAAFIARRVGSGLVATILIFVTVQLLPGDVASVVLGRASTPQRLAEIRQNLNLDESIASRYATFMSDLVRGDFGDSSAALVQGLKVPVSSVIGEPLRNSLVLAVLTLLIFIPSCLLFGLISALKAGSRTDHAISLTSLVIAAMPEFLIGTVLIVIFFTWLGALPAISPIIPGETPFSHPKNLILPVLTLSAAGLAFGARQVRASTIEALREDYVNMARLNGLPERRVVIRYALRNALGPAVQTLAQEAQYLIGGIIIIESVFNYPGIGSLLVKSVSVRDVQMVTVIATILAAIYIAINILADLAVVLLSPKLRTQL